MEIQELVDYQKKFLSLALQFIENDDNDEEYFRKLVEYFNCQKLSQNLCLLKIFLQLLCRISLHHFRKQGFFEKIVKIINYYQPIIKDNFTSSDIFDIFKDCKLLLFNLFQKNILPKEKSVIDLILLKDYNEGKDYKMFFITECEQFDRNK